MGIEREAARRKPFHWGGSKSPQKATTAHAAMAALRIRKHCHGSGGPQFFKCCERLGINCGAKISRGTARCRPCWTRRCEARRRTEWQHNIGTWPRRPPGGVAWLLATGTAFHLAWFRHWAVSQHALAWWWLNSAGLVGAPACAAWWLRPQPREKRTLSTGRPRLAWALLTLTLALTALLDARLRFPAQPLAWLLRPAHVVAFGLWFGGALWNIFIAVPAARETMAIPVVIASAEQLERFRRVVRVLLPTLIVTGLLQTLPYTGFHAATLIGSFFGRLILLKLGVVLALVGIFLTCPQWRACSPIRGMCDLDELQSPSAALQPSRRIDNRGKACAGFVHVQRALEGMAPGEVLELLSTDPISWWELPA